MSDREDTPGAVGWEHLLAGNTRWQSFRPWSEAIKTSRSRRRKKNTLKHRREMDGAAPVAAVTSPGQGDRNSRKKENKTHVSATRGLNAGPTIPSDWRLLRGVRDRGSPVQRQRGLTATSPIRHPVPDPTAGHPGGSNERTGKHGRRTCKDDTDREPPALLQEAGNKRRWKKLSATAALVSFRRPTRPRRGTEWNGNDTTSVGDN